MIQSALYSSRLLLALVLLAVPFGNSVIAVSLLEDVQERLVQRSSAWHDSVQVTYKPRAAAWPPVGELASIEPLSDKMRGTLVVDAILRDGSSVRLTVKVRTWDRIWSASRLIRSGETIYSDMIIPRLVETTRLRQDLLELDESPLGMTARRRIDKRDLLARTALESPLAVKAGSDVRLRLQCGLVIIDDAGHALQSGRIGEQIMVRSETTGKVLQGNISPDGIVYCPVQ